MICEVLFIVCIGLLIWHFVAYPLSMGAIGWIFRNRLRVMALTAIETYPLVTVIIPTYNEAGSIRGKVDNIILIGYDYPRHMMEVVFVDSASSDGTTAVISAEIRRLDGHGIKGILIQQDTRRGKGSAILESIPHTVGQILIVTDANTEFNQIAIRAMVSHFHDPRVGAVTGRMAPVGSDGPQWNHPHWLSDHFMRMGESVIDSCDSIYGEIGAFRRHLLRPDITQMAEDFDLAISIRMAGWKVVYEPRAVAFEAIPSSSHGLIVQHRRWTLGLICCMWKHKRWLCFPGDMYRAMIIPSHRGLRVVVPFLLAGTFVSICGMLVD